MKTPPPDQRERDRITGEHHRSVVVEASAGTGKTTLLTMRVASLVLEEGVPLENLAVVTFTEAAASELRVRIREVLRNRVPGLASAWITTIHGFASRVLREYPHLTGCHPDFKVETGHFSRREQRMLWDSFLSRLDPTVAVLSAEALAKPGSENLRELAEKIEPLRWITDMTPFGDTGREFSRGIRQLAEEVSAILELCQNPSDPLATKLAALRDRLSHGDCTGSVDLRSGSRAAWGGADGFRAVKDRVLALREGLSRLREIAAYMSVEPGLSQVVLPFSVRAREQWDSYGVRLSYDDLLHFAHRAVTGNPNLRAALAARFRHILIDEFQDTSLLQARLFLGILEGSGLQGRLTIVGDPKQSIYGWRNADVETYRETVELVQRSGALMETISTNFRSCRAVIDFVNAFGNELFSGAPDEQTPFLSPYSPLLPQPDAVHGPLPEVVRLPEPPEGTGAAEYKGRAQAEAAADILEKGNPGEWAVLFRSATRLEELVESLDRRGIPYIVEAGRDFKERPEVGDTAMLIRAVTDTGDIKALAHTLRSLYFGLDDATVTLALGGELTRDIHDALGVLEGLRTAAANLSPGLFLETVFRRTCIIEAVRQSRYEVNRRLSNLRCLLERAREYSGLDQLLDLLTGSSVHAAEEPSASPEGGEAVTLSTIHRAKGLSWTNVMVLYPGSRSGGRGSRLLSDQSANAAALKLGEGKSPHFQWLEAREKARSDAEFRRLLYVAVTRPRKRLVLFTDSGDKPSSPAGVLNLALKGAEGLYSEVILPPLNIDSLYPRQGVPAFRPPPSAVVPPPGAPEPGARERAMRLGNEVHALLEKIDFKAPEEWLDLYMPRMRGQMEFPDESAALVRAFFATPLPFPLEEARVVGREYPLLSRGAILYIDLLLDMGTHFEIIDFKTDRPESIGSMMAQYKSKQEQYASILERVTGRPAACRLILLQSRECVTLKEPPSPETRKGGR